jgi:HAD superfamily hydrolase (TIGR01509 family)
MAASLSDRGAMAATPEAVVFDFDGTLVDTEMVQYRAWRSALGRQGARFGMADWRLAVGRAPSTFDPVRLVETRDGRRLDRAAARQEAMAAIETACRRPRLRPGVGVWLADARALGLPVAIASNSERAWVAAWLESLGLAAAFGAVVTGDDVARPKPAPDIYRLAARRLGVRPTATLAVEDSPVGAQAALAAGMRCVVVPNAFTRAYAFPAEAERRSAFDGPPPWRSGG